MKHRSATTSVALALIASAGGFAALGQPDSDPTQVARLANAPFVASATPEQLRDLSRLLAAPQDQIEFLVGRAEKLAGEPAIMLAGLAEARLSVWTERGASGLGGYTARIKKLREQPKPPTGPIDLKTAAELATWLSSATQAQLDGLSRHDCSILWARGVPLASLKALKSGTAGWDRPRTVIADLTETPGFFKVVGFARQLNQNRAAVAGAAAAAPPFAAASFDIAGGFVALTLNGPGNNPSKWSTLAVTLEADTSAFWVWAALARLLEASETSGATRDDALGAAQANLTKLQTVSKANDAAHVATVIARWIDDARAGRGIFQSDATTRRTQRDGLAASAIAPGKSNDERLKLIQQAKAADVGLQVATPLSLEDLRQALRNEGRAGTAGVHLFLEMIEVNNQYFAVAIGARGADLATGPAWFDVWIGGKPTPDAVLSEALEHVVAGGRIAGPQVIVAPDGDARTAAWINGGDQKLWSMVAKAEREGYILYTPSASALRAGPGWDFNRTYEFWYRASLAAAPAAAGTLTQIKSIELPRGAGALKTRCKMALFSLDGSNVTINSYDRLRDEKAGRGGPVIAVLAAK